MAGVRLGGVCLRDEDLYIFISVKGVRAKRRYLFQQFNYIGPSVYSSIQYDCVPVQLFAFLVPSLKNLGAGWGTFSPPPGCATLCIVPVV